MMTMRAVGILVGLVTLSAWPTFAGDQHRANASAIVSLVDLIVRPQQVEGKVIQVTGFVGVRMTMFLYLTEGYASLKDISSAISVESSARRELESRDCVNRYATLIGLFGRWPDGSYGLKRLDEVRVPSKDWGSRVCWHRTDVDQ